MNDAVIKIVLILRQLLPFAVDDAHGGQQQRVDPHRPQLLPALQVADHLVDHRLGIDAAAFENCEPTPNQKLLQFFGEFANPHVPQRQLAYVGLLEAIGPAGRQQHVTRSAPLRNRLGQTGDEHFIR